MPWYIAHIIMYFEWKIQTQPEYLVQENLYLVEATSSREATTKAEILGRMDESPEDDGLFIGDQPARLRLAGVRKVVECLPPDERPTHGTEVSYTELTVDSLATVQALAAGKDVTVTYAEGMMDD